MRARRFRRWRADIQRPACAASALTLAHDIALRQHELRPLQRVLTDQKTSRLRTLHSW